MVCTCELGGPILTNVAFLAGGGSGEVHLVPSHLQQYEEERRKLKERKAAKTILIIVGAAFLCYAPTVLLLITSSLAIDEISVQTVARIVLTCTFANSTLNPFIYYWKNTAMREGMKRVLRRLFPVLQTRVVAAPKTRISRSDKS